MPEEQALHSYRSADLDMNMNKIERSRGRGSKSLIINIRALKIVRGHTSCIRSKNPSVSVQLMLLFILNAVKTFHSQNT